jgi:outer membrane protein, multidrug efflux system
MTKIIQYSLIGLITILFACKTAKQDSQLNNSLPESYLNNVKTEKNISLEKPSEFFKDKFLIALIDSALAKNFDLLMNNQHIAEYQSYLKQTKGAFLPTLAANTTVGQRKFGYYTMDGVGNYDTQFSPNITKDMIIPEHLPDYYVGLQSSWEIDIWGKLKNQKKAAFSRYLASKEVQKLITTQIVSEVAKAYYELLALDQELLIIKENTSLQERALEIVKIQKEAGKANSFNVKQTESQLFNSKSLETLKKQRIFEVENYINQLLGRYPQAIERSEPILKQKMLTEIETGIPMDLVNNRPDINKAKLEYSASIADKKVAKSMFYPSLTLNAALGLNAFNPNFVFQIPQSIAYGVMGGFLAPILQRKALKAELNRSESRLLNSTLNYQKTLLVAYYEVINNYTKINNINTFNELKSREVASLTEATAISNELYLTGQLYYLDVIFARKMVLEAQIELAENKKEQFFALIELYRSLGGGWR